MKISQMLQREDFYTINQKTLESFFGSKGEQSTRLYVYPKLNAIVTATPSQKVIEYLLCEYSVRSNIIKRTIVQSYVMACLLSRGLLSSKCIEICDSICSDVLIYPCNKKYRIFDFGKNVVSVVNKVGFSNCDLLREIEFRKAECLPSFVPKLICYDDSGYTEAIIHGRPLARVSSDFEPYREQAYKMLLDYGEHQREYVNAGKYTESLLAEISRLADQKVTDKENVLRIARRLADCLSEDVIVPLVFSHGDLQAGNIWIENETNHIYIIDWESWGKRSIWYDKAVLYQNLRPGGVEAYFDAEVAEEERAVALLEDLVYQLSELNNLPLAFGIEGFETYIGKLQQGLDHRMGVRE